MWIAALLFLVILLIYLFIIRPILQKQPAFSETFKAEASFFTKLRAKLAGWKTKIAARLVGLGGIIVGLQTFLQASGVDITPFTTELSNMIPEKYRGLLVAGSMIGVGLLFTWLRRVTDNPPIVQTSIVDSSGEPKVVAVIPPVK